MADRYGDQLGGVYEHNKPAQYGDWQQSQQPPYPYGDRAPQPVGQAPPMHRRPDEEAYGKNPYEAPVYPPVDARVYPPQPLVDGRMPPVAYGQAPPAGAAPPPPLGAPAYTSYSSVGYGAPPSALPPTSGGYGVPPAMVPPTAGGPGASPYSGPPAYTSRPPPSGPGGYQSESNRPNFRGGAGNGAPRPNYDKGYGGRSNYGSVGSGMEQQQDTVFVSGLPEEATEKELQEHFGSIGLIKMDKKTGKPKIWIYRDKATGKPKGEATITFDDPPTASSAINWFNGKPFLGSNIKVELAQRKAFTGFNRGGGDRGGDRRDRGDRGDNDGGSRRFGGGGGGGERNVREGDWPCPSEDCGNNNFSWRKECNRCKTPKPEGLGGGDRRGGSAPYGADRRPGRGSFAGRNGGGGYGDRNGRNFGGGRDGNGYRSGGGPMRGDGPRRGAPY